MTGEVDVRAADARGGEAVVGVDVGGTKIAAAVVRGTEVIGRVEYPTDTASEERLVEEVAAAAVAALEGAGEAAAVGVGVPSQIDAASGRVLSSVNVPLAGIALRDELRQRLGMPVYVDNDANCAALAEAQLVPDPPARELVMLTLGTGVGGGIVVDGKIYRGATGIAAELGHLVIDGASALADSGDAFPRPGSLEWHCSGTGLEREASALGRERPDSALGEVYAQHGRVSGRHAEAAARGGDAAALGLFAQLARWLGIGIASVANALEPERIVIGGGLSRAADLFLDAAREEAARCALSTIWERVIVEVARGGPDAGTIGAATLAAQELQRSRHTAR